MKFNEIGTVSATDMSTNVLEEVTGELVNVAEEPVNVKPSIKFLAVALGSDKLMQRVSQVMSAPIPGQVYSEDHFNRDALKRFAANQIAKYPDRFPAGSWFFDGSEGLPRGDTWYDVDELMASDMFDRLFDSLIEAAKEATVNTKAARAERIRGVRPKREPTGEKPAKEVAVVAIVKGGTRETGDEEMRVELVERSVRPSAFENATVLYRVNDKECAWPFDVVYKTSQYLVVVSQSAPEIVYSIGNGTLYAQWKVQ